MERALTECFEEGVLAHLVTYYSVLGLSRSHPRLETVLDVVRRVNGLGALVDILSDLRSAPPNDLHRFFAAHNRLDGRHVTANFDTCIEDAGGKDVFHFHGSFADGADMLGATLSRIQRGFPVDFATLLEDMLTSSAVLVFVGYSGSDAFDVEPFLRVLPARSLSGRTVLWLRYASTSTIEVRRQSGDAKVARHLDLIASAGAECAEIVGEPTAVLSALASAWGLPPPVKPRPCAPTWTPTYVVDDGARWRATLELWATMGLHHEVKRLLDIRPASDAGHLMIAAQTSWAQGRYRAARRQWRQAFRGPGPIERARRAERVGATIWVQGRLLHAYVYLRRALRRADSAGISGECIWLLAETLGRVLEHMQRRPLLRRFASDKRKQFVRGYLPSTPSDGYTSHGVHLDARIGGIAKVLGAPIDQSLSPPITAFDEAEALNALLNYRHADLRRRANETPKPAPEEYRRQRDQFLAIGALGDAPRVYSIPGAGRAFTYRELRHDLSGVELAPWARLLLVSRFLRERFHSRKAT